MKRICFDKRFVDFEKSDLIKGKIHSIRQSYLFWKRFEGQEVALFTWEGKPYRSKQKVFCVKRIVSVQEENFSIFKSISNYSRRIIFSTHNGLFKIPNLYELAYNDGFNFVQELAEFLNEFKPGKMAILHFTDFRY